LHQWIGENKPGKILSEGKGMEVIKKAVRSSCTGMFFKQ
jgi:hypothetical protein